MDFYIKNIIKKNKAGKWYYNDQTRLKREDYRRKIIVRKFHYRMRYFILKNKCEICGKKSQLIIHHKKYGKDYTKYCQTLCFKCHGKVHSLMGKKPPIVFGEDLTINPEFKCFDCGYEWAERSLCGSRRCPHCKSLRWNIPFKQRRLRAKRFNELRKILKKTTF